MEEKDERKARQKFLYQYFTRLKQWLNRFEFEFVKQLYVEGREEKYVFDTLGLQPKRFKSNLQAKLAEHTVEVQELAERSEWEDAELFSRTFLASPSEILQDKELLTAKPKTVKGFGNLIEAQSRRERYLQADSDRYYQRKVYMRGYMAGQYAATHKNFKKIKDLVRGLYPLLRSLSFDCVSIFAKTFGVETDNPAFELFGKSYCAIYDTIADTYNDLYKIVVEGVDIEEVENEQKERYERHKQQIQAKLLNETDGETSE